MDRIGEFRLGPVELRRLRDRYFDTGDHALRSRQIALRIRQSDHALLLALKGGGSSHGGLTTRLELEGPWSDSFVEGVWEALGEVGVRPGDPPSTAPPDPATTLRAAGFDVIQERTCLRRARAVLADEGRDRVAEVAIDDVRYRLGPTTVRLLEIEVETTIAAPDPSSSTLAALRDRYGRRVRPWPHSKLATGLALQELLARHAGETAPEESMITIEQVGQVEAALLAADTVLPPSPG